MVRTIVLALVMGTAVAATQDVRRPFTLQDLTVPVGDLPGACALSPAASARISGNTVRGGLWAGLPISTNPWAGSDPPVIASIRELIDPPLLPDGPPLTTRESARYRFRLADGIDEAYAAIYAESDSRSLVVVYGLRFSSAEHASGFLRDARALKTRRVVSVAIGPIVAVVSGDGGQCFQAVGAYLTSLER